VLASSQFNGMDGVEFGQSISVKLGDEKMSGLGSSRTSQDVQDNIRGSRNSSIAVQGAEISPRRTRSGKIVNCGID
jgi:hypothetical protein